MLESVESGQQYQYAVQTEDGTQTVGPPGQALPVATQHAPQQQHHVENKVHHKPKYGGPVHAKEANHSTPGRLFPRQVALRCLRFTVFGNQTGVADV